MIQYFSNWPELESSVPSWLSEEDRNVEWVVALAVEWLTKQLCMLPGNVSFPATQGGC